MSASSSASSGASSILSAQRRVPAAAASVRRVLAVVRRLNRLSRPDDERIAQHRDAVYRRVQRLPLG